MHETFRFTRRCSFAALAVLGLFLASNLRATDEPSRLIVHGDRPGVRISPTLYGLMTEEINYSYQGGLYGELIQNRDFKDDSGPTTRHWSLHNAPGAAATMTLDANQPVNTTALTTSLRLDITAANDKQTVRLANDGYWGIPVRPETTYRASFYARGDSGFAGPLTASIESVDGATVFARAEVPAIGAGWKQYIVALTTAKAAPTKDARFVLSAAHPGTLWLNLVSLFPPTYHNRPNGSRIDLMEKLVAMKPSFLRFPGGNYLEGDTFAERFDWKKTVGPISERPGHRSPWNYHSTDGLGLLEFLEWCEDMHAEPLLAVFAGYALKGEHVIGPALQPYIQEALDEVEYVTGDVSTPWGARRAADGHPAPFPLRYVEIGNEDWFDRSKSYDGRFAQFHDAFKAKYPQLQLIATAPVKSRVPDVVDDHFYNTWKKTAADVHHYDGFSRTGPKIFVGEWASQDVPKPWVDPEKKGPTPAFQSALGDAAWMIGMERNSDVVVLQCYAPLLVNVNPGGRQWAVNLIGYDALHSFVSPSYLAQTMFSNHRGDVVLPVSFITADVKPPQTVPYGGIGVGTWKTQAEFKEIEVTRGGEVLYKSADAWSFGTGDWKNQDGILRQTGGQTDAVATAGSAGWSDYTYHLKARKLGGSEGFLIRFLAEDKDNYLHLNLGGWSNQDHGLEKTTGGQRGELGGRVPGTIETGRWYDIRIEVRGAEIRCFLDDKLIVSATDAPAAPEPVIASASRDEASGDVILKAVNITAQSQAFRVEFQGVPTINATATGQVLSGGLDEVNSLETPDKIAPREITVQNAGQSFTHEFPARSITVLRFKTR